MAVRSEAVAGTFYPASAAQLGEVVGRFLDDRPPAPEAFRFLMGPHAGYVYSGAIAGAGYRLAAVPPLVVVLAPNHHGIGAPFALPRAGRWRTPLGELAIDEEASTAIAARSALFEDDWVAHSRDHALEVHLPFLQVLARRLGRPDPLLVTLSVGTHDGEALLEAGRSLAEGLRDRGAVSPAEVLLVVSSDMSHYIPAAEARRLDVPVLEKVVAGDPEGVFRQVMTHGVTMCGVAPAVVGLAAARELGAGAGELVRYGHSGEVTGDDTSVVAYATVVLRAAA